MEEEDEAEEEEEDGGEAEEAISRSAPATGIARNVER